MPNVYLTKIIENTRVAEKIYSLKIACKDIAVSAKAGQFVHISCGNERILRRPISICDIEDEQVRIVFEVKGEGTKWLSQRSAGESIDVLGPLGNGFTVPDGDVIVIGGGIGVPPMLYAARTAAQAEVATANKRTVTAILGFQSSEKAVLQSEFEEICKQVIITTDDGSMGTKGFVTQPLEKLFTEGEPVARTAVLSCGPYPMQKAVAEFCRSYNVPCQVSLEERMGCGVGACLVCACATQKDGLKHMSRVCADGPVFDGKDILW